MIFFGDVSGVEIGFKIMFCISFSLIHMLYELIKVEYQLNLDIIYKDLFIVFVHCRCV